MGGIMAVGIMLLVIVLYLVVLLFVLANYIITALSFQTIAKRRGIEKPWLVWIPYAQFYTIGKITNEYDKRNGYDRPWHKYLITLAIAVAALMTAGYAVFYCGLVISAILSETQYYYEPGALEIICIAVGYIGIILAAVASVAFNALYSISIYKIFESLKPEKAIKYILLYLLVPLAGPICLYKNRNEGYPVSEICCQTEDAPCVDCETTEF